MRTIPFLHNRQSEQSEQSESEQSGPSAGDAKPRTWRKPAWGLAILTVAAAAALATAGTATAASATATAPAVRTTHAVQAARYVVSWPLVQKGDRGQRVVAIQYLLNEQIGAGLTPDGIFGDATERAVKTFQARHGLTQDGKVGSSTWVKLVVQVKKGSRGSAVKAVQSNLNVSYGYHYVTVDGVFGDHTDRAVRDFQRTHPPLHEDGVVGTNTWQALVYFER